MISDEAFPGNVEFVVRDGEGKVTISTLTEALAFLKKHPELELGNRLGTIKRLESGPPIATTYRRLIRLAGLEWPSGRCCRPVTTALGFLRMPAPSTRNKSVRKPSRRFRGATATE